MARRPEGAPVEPQEYDELLRTLLRIAAHQETINTDQRTINIIQAIHELGITPTFVRS